MLNFNNLSAIHVHSQSTYYIFIILFAVIVDVVLNFTIGLILKRKFSDGAVTFALTIVTLFITIPLAVYVIPNFVTY